MERIKVTIIGAGGTGEQTAIALSSMHHLQIQLIDNAPGVAEGKALDIGQAGCLMGHDISISGGTDIEGCRDSHIVVITAGAGRRPGLAREDMLTMNGQIVRDIARVIRTHCPNAFVIVLTNPADLLARLLWQETGFPSERVMAQGGILDSARLAAFTAQHLRVSNRDIRAMVLGGHGDSMVPIRNCVTVHGVPIDQFITDTDWAELVARTRNGGSEILGKFKTHGASVTPGFAVAQMVEALTQNVPRLLPISTRSMGSYGLNHDIFIGLPVFVSNHGIEKIIELPLTELEQTALSHSAQILQSAWQAWA